jgi:hypothetical protein
MLDEGVYTSVSEIGDAEHISKSYVSRILRLALLAPDIVDAILAGRTDQALMLERLERPLSRSDFLWTSPDGVSLRRGHSGRAPDWSPCVASADPVEDNTCEGRIRCASSSSISFRRPASRRNVGLGPIPGQRRS